jgi:hypothetical protein
MPSNYKNGPVPGTTAPALRARLKKLEQRRNAKQSRPELGRKRTYETGFGPIGVSRGWGGQARVTSMEGDYPASQRIGTGKYSELKVSKAELTDLFAKRNPRQGGPKRARQLNRRRAMLRGIVLHAENSTKRFAGADKIARAVVRYGEAKQLSYEKLFVGSKPVFAMAAKGGARSYGRFVDGEDNLTPEQLEALDHMSEASDGEDVAMDEMV